MRIRKLTLLSACFFAFHSAGAGAFAENATPAPAALAPHIWAQHLIDLALAAHPEVVVLVIHATPPNSTNNVIVASNIGRIGKLADADDLGVINSAQPKTSFNKTGDRFEVLEPLKGVGGDLLGGAIGVVFKYEKGADTRQDESVAADIQSFVQMHVLSNGNLMDPYPYVSGLPPELTPENAAQALVDKTMARHPELLVLGMHVTLPGGAGNVMLASNIGRFGKKADEDDMRVVKTERPNLEVSENGKRFEVECVLKDALGRNIGALGIVFAYKPGNDKAALQALGEKIRDEMAREIPAASALLAKAG